jgi:hypothetical protein
MFRSLLLCLVLLILSAASSVENTAAAVPAQGYALSFDYKQYVKVANSDSLNPDHITVECWVKFRRLDIQKQFFICKGISQQYSLYILNGSILGFALFGNKVESPAIVLIPERWYHLAGIYDGNSIRVVINGETIGNKEIGKVLNLSSDPLYFNHFVSLENGNYFTGDMDEIRIWSIGRSDFDIRDNMYREIGPVPGLVGAWHFNEGTGYVAKDSAGGNDGILGQYPGPNSLEPKWIESDIRFTNTRILSPAKDDIWQSGTVHTILWGEDDLITGRIEFSEDGGTNWSVIADTVDGTSGSFSWQLPDVDSDRCIIRMIEPSPSGATLYNQGFFTITRPYIHVTSPNGGERLDIGYSYSLTWTALGVKTVRIEFSTDSGKTWKTVIESIDALQGSYTWTIPGGESGECLVRITDTSAPGLSDTSDGVFTIIRPLITVTSPNGGETLQGGKMALITWNSKAIDRVKIEYSLDSGASWKTIAKNVATTRGIFTFAVPTIQSSLGLVRISDQANPAFSDRSDAVFSIVSQPSSTKVQKVFTSFTASDAVYGIALQGNYVWCATANGPVRYDKRDMSYQIFNSIPDNRVSSVAVDSGGNVWFGSQNGIYRWDGSTWKSYNRDSGLPDSRVNALAAGNNHDIWIGTYTRTPGVYFDDYSKELSYFDGSKFTFYYSKSGSAYPVPGPLASFVVFSPTDLWMVDMSYNSSVVGNIAHFDGTELKNISLNNGPPGGTVRQIASGLGKNLWITAQGRVYKSDGTTCTVLSDSLGITTALASDAQGNVYVAAMSGDSDKRSSLFRYDGVRWTNSYIGSGDSFAVSTLVADTQGIVWAGAPSGLYRLKNDAWSKFTLKNRLPSNDIRKIAFDAYGTMLAATQYNLIKYDGMEWKTVTTDEITSLISSPDGSAWISTTKGIARFDRTIFTSYTTTEGLDPLVTIKSIKTDFSGDVWAETSLNDSFSGFYRFDGAKWVKYPGREFNGINFNTWTIDRDGTLWVGTNQIYPFNLQLISARKTYSWSYPSGFDFRIDDMTVDHDGTLWLLNFWNKWTTHSPNNFGIISRVDSNAVNTAFEIPGNGKCIGISWDNSVWAGTIPYNSSTRGLGFLGGGLAQVNAAAISTIYTTDNGLIDNNVVSLAFEPDGAVWVVTPLGITRYGEISSFPSHVAESPGIPTALSLNGNYPNPFNSSTIITFTISGNAHSKLIIYNIEGQKVRTLVSGELFAGSHSVIWDGRDDSGRPVSSGVYLSRLSIGKKVSLGRMLLLK